MEDYSTTLNRKSEVMMCIIQWTMEHSGSMVWLCSRSSLIHFACIGVAPLDCSRTGKPYTLHVATSDDCSYGMQYKTFVLHSLSRICLAAQWTLIRIVLLPLLLTGSLLQNCGLQHNKIMVGTFSCFPFGWSNTSKMVSKILEWVLQSPISEFISG